jgi:hypothetical protein
MKAFEDLHLSVAAFRQSAANPGVFQNAAFCRKPLRPSGVDFCP